VSYQPAVGVSNAIAIADAFVQRHASAARWSETTLATATRWISAFQVRIPAGLRAAPGCPRALQKSGCDLQRRFVSHGGLTPPRSCVAVANVCRRKNDLCDARTHIPKSGGRQPAVGLVTQLQGCPCTDHRLVASARQLRCCRCKRVSRTTAGSRQPLLVARAQIAAEKRLRFATAFCIPRGAYAPRSWCRANICRRKNDLCDARTRIPRSGGRQPAVGMSNAVAIADAFVQRPASACRWSETTVATATRWISAFRVRIPRTSHGGLTPPALTLQCECLSAKKRFVRCTNAHSQERRVSARRGG
jgi:hypothetical protein